MKKWLLAFVFGFIAATAISQPLVQQALTGNEAVLVQGGGPGGPGAFTNVAALRNGLNAQLVAGTGTVNSTVGPNDGVLITTAVPTTWNITMPKAPFDGQMVRVSCTAGNITTVAVTYTPATLVGDALTTCVENIGATWIYASTPNVWYRLQ